MYSDKWIFNWNGFSNQIKDSIIELDNYGELISEKIGIRNIKSKQWERQNWIFNNISENQLMKLTNYPSGNVKGFAYESLLKKGKIDQFSLLKKSLNDTLSFVHYQSGCIGNGFMLSDYLINNVIMIENPNLNINPIKLNLKESEKDEIISLLKIRKQNESKYKKIYQKSLK